MAASSLGLALLRDALEAALARFLALDPDAASRLLPLQGKVVALRVSPWTGTLFIYHTARGVQIHGRFHREADVILSGTLWAFAGAGMASSPESTLFGGQVRVEGDADVAKRFAGLLDALHLDWEGLLVQALGHEAGDRLVASLQAARRWGRESLQTLRWNVAEFLQEEIRALPAKPETEEFLRQVDTLRADCDRLEVRIERLLAHSPGQGSS